MYAKLGTVGNRRSPYEPLRSHCPTLVIAGSGDAINPVKDCEQMAAAIPGSEIAVISQSGHLSNLENPASFNQAIGPFLGRP